MEPEAGEAGIGRGGEGFKSPRAKGDSEGSDAVGLRMATESNGGGNYKVRAFEGIEKECCRGGKLR